MKPNIVIVSPTALSMACMIAAEKLAAHHNANLEIIVQKDLSPPKKELDEATLMQYITALEPQPFIEPSWKETRRDRTHPNEPFWKKLNNHKRKHNW